MSDTFPYTFPFKFIEFTRYFRLKSSLRQDLSLSSSLGTGLDLSSSLSTDSNITPSCNTGLQLGSSLSTDLTIRSELKGG